MGWGPFKNQRIWKKKYTNSSVRTLKGGSPGEEDGVGWRRRSGSGDAVLLARPLGRRIDFRCGSWLRMSGPIAPSFSLRVISLTFCMLCTTGMRVNSAYITPTALHLPTHPFNSLCLVNEAFRWTGPVIPQHYCCCFPLGAHLHPPITRNALLFSWQLMLLLPNKVNVAKALKVQLGL